MLVSTTFALMSCTVGIYVISNRGSSVMNDKYPIIHHFLVVGASYFAYDLLAMYQAFKETTIPDQGATAASNAKATPLSFLRARPLIIFHHILLPFIGVPVFLSQVNRGDYLIAVFLLMEGSTPSVSLRRILELLDMKSSLLYAVNGLFMTIIFFLCRIASVVYIYHTFAQELGLPLWDTISKHVPWHCNACTAVFTVLQTYWWSLMLRGLFKFMKKSNARQKVE